MDGRTASRDDGVVNEGHDGSEQTFVTRMPGPYRVGVVILGGLTTSAVVVPLSAEISSMTSVVLVIFLAALFNAVFSMRAVVRLGMNDVHIRVAGIFTTTIPYDQITEVVADRVTGVREGWDCGCCRMRPSAIWWGVPLCVYIPAEAPLSWFPQARRTSFRKLSAVVPELRHDDDERLGPRPKRRQLRSRSKLPRALNRGRNCARIDRGRHRDKRGVVIPEYHP